MTIARHLGRRRFSVQFLLGLTAGCALLLGVWKAFIDEPPTHKLPAYERASPTRRLALQIGPNRVRVRSVARNDRDGRVTIETGDGRTLTATVPRRDELVSSAPWLDVVQVELAPGPDRVEIIEARIFDHATRILVSQRDAAYGWQVVDPNLVQIYGLGKELPPLLDVWLRVHTYGATDRAATLLPAVGSEVAVAEGTVTVAAIQQGFAGWNSTTGFFPPPEGDPFDVGETAFVLAWQGAVSSLQRFQVAVVTVAGDRYYSDQLAMFDGRGLRQSLLLFDVPLDQIQQLELRPDRGQHRFFFEALQSPVGRAGTFTGAPAITLPVEDLAAPTAVAMLTPLRMLVEVTPGAWARGSTSNGRRSRIIRREPERRSSTFTLCYELRGLGGVPTAVRFRDAATATWLPDSAVASSGHSQASGAANQVVARTYSAPLETVDAVELSVLAPP